MAKIGILIRKVIVYGMKGDFYLDKNITCMLSYIAYLRKKEVLSDVLS